MNKISVCRRPPFSCALLLLAVLAGAARAMPPTIGYQGQLTDASGTPVNTDVRMVFRLWTIPEGGSVVWAETQNVVQVRSGLFNVALGAVNPIPSGMFDIQQGASRYLSIQVESDAQMEPRIPLHSVAFAQSAGSATMAYNAIAPWRTSGSALYYNSGNVGVGISSPGEKFHVYASSGNVKAKIESTSGDADLVVDAGGANNPTVEFHRNGVYAGGVGFDSTRTNMFIYHNGTVAFKNGMVGIGTFTPTNHLEVHGNVLVTGQVRGTFPRPDYDSGWVVLSTAGGSQDGVATLTHNLGGNVDNYVVDLMSRDPNSGYGINNHGIGTYPTERGFFFWNLTTTSLGIFRESSDVTSDEVRVRIWVYN
jgi:hypothetical protein